MKQFVLFLGVSMFMISCNSGLLDEAALYQKELKSFYEDPATTPLSEEEKAQFKGITFFPISDRYRVESKFEPMINGTVIPFPTSANKVKRYKQYGTFRFSIDGTELVLTGYVTEPEMPENPDYVFIPFRDATSGKTSYGAGRYLEIDKSAIRQGQAILDFNKAYNPYCAYSANYNCPIPPDVNTLSIPIEAGVSYIATEH